MEKLDQHTEVLDKHLLKIENKLNR
jgi:hypothetical protein